MKIKRPIFNRLYAEKLEPEISILLGTRQVGKTTLMRDMECQAKQDGHTTAFYNLESSSDLAIFHGSHADIVHILTNNVDIIFIDEFHYLNNASKLFKEIYDSEKKVKIYASGSSSVEIHKHLKESLSGRFRKTIIYPLIHSEFEQAYPDDFAAFYQWGGLPGLIHRSNPHDKMDLLENIVSTYITKDIKALIKEENVRSFNAMIYYLAQNQGSLTVFANIARDTGIAESTVSRYLDIMAHTYTCYSLNSYSTNLANELKKSKKCYLYDIGIRNSILKDFRDVMHREDKGYIYESYVLHHLQPQLSPNMELRFWRTKKGMEVDFICLKNRQAIPIEVKSGLTDAIIPKGMRSFLTLYPNTIYGIVFNEMVHDRIVTNGHVIDFLPLEKVAQCMSYIDNMIP